MKHMTLTVSPEESIKRGPQFAWWSPFLSSSDTPAPAPGSKDDQFVRVFLTWLVAAGFCHQG